MEIELGPLVGTEWTVLGFERCTPTPSSPTGKLGARCRCSCGYEAVINLNNLRRGTTTRCKVCRSRMGAKAMWTENLNSHKLSYHPLYRTWEGMMQRCDNPRATDYAVYGGRGIEVCPEWHDVRVFIEWIETNLGPRPEGMSLDRYPDPDGNYVAGNVRWADWNQQRENRSR